MKIRIWCFLEWHIDITVILFHACYHVWWEFSKPSVLCCLGLIIYLGQPVWVIRNTMKQYVSRIGWTSDSDYREQTSCSVKNRKPEECERICLCVGIMFNIYEINIVRALCFDEINFLNKGLDGSSNTFELNTSTAGPPGWSFWRNRIRLHASLVRALKEGKEERRRLSAMAMTSIIIRRHAFLFWITPAHVLTYTGWVQQSLHSFVSDAMLRGLSTFLRKAQVLLPKILV